MRAVLFCLVVSANALPEAHLRGRVKDHLRDRDLSVPEDAKNHYANTDASSDEISATNLEEGGFGLGLRRLLGLASNEKPSPPAGKGRPGRVHRGASKDTKSKAETAYATGGHARPVLETEVSPRDQDKVSQHKTQGADAALAELADAHNKGGDAIDAAHGNGDPATSIKGTLSHEGASKDIKSKAETAYATPATRGPCSRRRFAAGPGQGLAAQNSRAGTQGHALSSVGGVPARQACNVGGRERLIDRVFGTPWPSASLPRRRATPAPTVVKPRLAIVTLDCGSAEQGFVARRVNLSPSHSMRV